MSETVFEIVVGDVGGLDTHGLHLHVVRLLARLLLLFLLVVAVLAVIHDTADRGPRLGRDLYQVQVRLFGLLHSLSRVDDADLLALGVDQAHLRHADGIVNSRKRLLLSGDSLGLRST